MRDIKLTAADILAVSSTLSDSMHTIGYRANRSGPTHHDEHKRKPSGKNRDKVKAARKQNQRKRK